MEYKVYAIKSNNRNYIYVGLTRDLNRRLSQHNYGKEITTRTYAPFKLIYTETFPDRVSARVREKYLKSGIGKEFLKSLLNNGQVAELAYAYGSEPYPVRVEGSNPSLPIIEVMRNWNTCLPAGRRVRLRTVSRKG